MPSSLPTASMAARLTQPCCSWARHSNRDHGRLLAAGADTGHDFCSAQAWFSAVNAKAGGLDGLICKTADRH